MCDTEGAIGRARINRPSLSEKSAPASCAGTVVPVWRSCSPREVSAKRASEFITDAVNDYGIQCERYTNLEILKATDLELHDAREAWAERPNCRS
jgi:hypothetical protein